MAKIIEILATAKVEFILIGGIAATAHGSARVTYDIDVVYHRTSDNLARLAAALEPYQPYPRGAPSGLPFRWDAATLQRGLNFTLTTSIGDLDIFGEVAGGGTYQNLRQHSLPIRIFGVDCLCVDLPTLIHLKRAAGRPRDFEAIAELEAIEKKDSAARHP